MFLLGPQRIFCTNVKTNIMFVKGGVFFVETWQSPRRS